MDPRERIRLGGQLAAEDGDELEGVGEEDRIGGGARLQDGRDCRREEVGEVNERVRLRRALLGRRAAQRKRDNDVDGRVLGLPRVGGGGGLAEEGTSGRVRRADDEEGTSREDEEGRPRVGEEGKGEEGRPMEGEQ